MKFTSVSVRIYFHTVGNEWKNHVHSTNFPVNAVEKTSISRSSHSFFNPNAAGLQEKYSKITS